MLPFPFIQCFTRRCGQVMPNTQSHPGPNVTIAFFPGDPSKNQLFPVLSDHELYAIGRVTVAFALLEHVLLDATLEVVAARHIPIPDGTFGISFKRRLTVWRALIRRYRRGKPRERL